MFVTAWMLGLITTLQVPPPEPQADVAAGLRAERQALLVNETTQLKALAERLAGQGHPKEAAEIRAHIEPDPPPNGPSRFAPLAEVFPTAAKGLANVPANSAPAQIEAGKIRKASATTLFDVAKRAGADKHYALADECLRLVLARDPAHGEARRLLGYVPHEGGWATPFAVKMLKAGSVRHPVFGWVPADWVPHLDRGELPAPLKSATQKERVWLPAEQADDLRRDWANAWQIDTEHFRIKTNVPLSEAIAFGRRLEDFHQLFFAVMADVLGDDLPLAQRFRNPKLVPKTTEKKHLVSYFASKEQYIRHLSPRQGESINNSLGVYITPREAKRFREPPTSYFFRDEEGELDVTATLYHEVSHQLLFESAGKSAYEQNVGNYWVFEGLGTYFETVMPQEDGSIHYGGLIGPRIAQARERLIERDDYIPLDHLVAMGQSTFSSDQGDIYLRYAESMALTVFFMQANGGEYRDRFLDYVENAYRGRLRRGTAHPLEARLGERYAALDRQFLGFLKAGTSPTAEQ